MIYFLTFSCKSSYSNNYETPEGTFPFQLFIRIEIKTRKLERKAKQQTSRLNDLLSRLIDLISFKRYNKSFKRCLCCLDSRSYFLILISILINYGKES